MEVCFAGSSKVFEEIERGEREVSKVLKVTSEINSVKWLLLKQCPQKLRRRRQIVSPTDIRGNNYVLTTHVHCTSA